MSCLTWVWLSSKKNKNKFQALAHMDSLTNIYNRYGFDELAEKMNQYWSNFIKTGDPNGDGLAFWPEADENMGYIDLGAGISTHDEEMTDLEKLMMDYTTNYFNFPVAD